jgi:hypothetical protein
MLVDLEVQSSITLEDCWGCALKRPKAPKKEEDINHPFERETWNHI